MIYFEKNLGNFGQAMAIPAVSLPTALLGKNYRSSTKNQLAQSDIVHRMLIKNGKRTMMIRCILTELLECKVHEKRLCLLTSCNNSVRKHQIILAF